MTGAAHLTRRELVGTLAGAAAVTVLAPFAFRDEIDIEGIDHPQRMFDVTEGLLRRGYGEDDVRGILGGNFQRVLGEIWNA